MSQSRSDCKRLTTIPGVGILTATALVASISDVKNFKNGRHLAAWLGLIPKQHSSGEKQRLLGISKRGNKYLRMWLTHGGCAVVLRCVNKKDSCNVWIQEKLKRSGMNKTAVAVLSRNARIAWVLLSNRQDYCVA